LKVRYLLLVALGLVLGVGIPLGLGGETLLQVLGGVHATHLAGMLALIGLAWNLNAGRVRLLVGGIGARQFGQGEALAVVMATEFAICATPGGAGGPPTYSYLLRRKGIAAVDGLALYTVDQLLDMVFFLTAMGVFLLYDLLVPSELHLGWQLLLLGVLLMSGLLLVFAVVRRYRRLLLFVGRLLRWLGVGARGRKRVMRRLLEYRRGLLEVGGFSAWRLWGLYASCTGHWLLRYSILYLAVREVGGELGWIHAFLVQMLSLTAGYATFLPGGSGGAEVGASMLLLPHLGSAQAAASILLWRFCTFYWYLIAGAPVFVHLAGGPVWRQIRRSMVPGPVAGR